VDEMRKVLHLRNQWARLAGLPVSDQIELQQNIKHSDRREQDAGEAQIIPLSRSGERQRHRPASAILAAVAPALTLDLRAANPYPVFPLINVTTNIAPFTRL